MAEKKLNELREDEQEQVSGGAVAEHPIMKKGIPCVLGKYGCPMPLPKKKKDFRKVVMDMTEKVAEKMKHATGKVSTSDASEKEEE